MQRRVGPEQSKQIAIRVVADGSTRKRTKVGDTVVRRPGRFAANGLDESTALFPMRGQVDGERAVDGVGSFTSR